MVRKFMAAGVALAVLSTGFVAPAQAKHHKKMAKMKLVPAQAKPGYRSLAGGPPGLIDIPPVPANGGVLHAGIIPGTGLFTGVPVLGDFGL